MSEPARPRASLKLTALPARPSVIHPNSNGFTSLDDRTQISTFPPKDSPAQSCAVTRTAKLSILMAAYNEELTVLSAIDEILRIEYPCEIELVIVDDGSTDNTPHLLSQVEDSRVIKHRHERNLGKGAALLTALSIATGTHILPFDADQEYAAEDIPRMLAPILKGRCNVVYGARLFGCNTVYQSYRYAVGNHILTSMTNILYNSHLSDLHTCLKLIPAALMRDLELRESGFGLDTEITALILRKGIRPFEVPVTYYSRSHDEGKKITWRDGVACLWILLRVRFGWPQAAKRTVTAPSIGAFELEPDRGVTYSTHAVHVAEESEEIDALTAG